MSVLTDKEKEEIKSLKPGFNIVYEHKDPMVIAANRVEISRKWSQKLLKIAFVFNTISVICFLIAGFLVYIKPQPDYYVTTPSGKIFGPLQKVDIN